MLTLLVSLALLAPPVARVAVTAPDGLHDTVTVGDTIPVTASGTLTNGRASGALAIKWGSSDPSRATVVVLAPPAPSAFARVVAVAPGTVRITATATSYTVSGSRVLVIRARPPAVDTTHVVVVPPPVDTAHVVVPPPPALDTARTPQLPALLDTRAPVSTGRTLVVSATGSVQAAIDSARPGDVITLANGATYTGTLVLPAKAGSTPTAGGWITIRPADTTALPRAGTRLAPRTLPAGTLPRLVTPNETPVLTTAPGAAGYRLTGVELTGSGAINYGLVAFGGGLETALSQYPGRLVLDRVWLHGGPTLDLKRCASLNAIAVAVIDSYVSDCRAKIGAFDETQGLLGWNGPGPFKITNNYIEAGGVSLMFGGAADPQIPGVIPSDIEIRHNHVVKPLAWQGLMTNKNSLELKDAQRVLVEGNVFEHNWADAQSGFMVQLTAVSQSNTAAWIAVRDVTMRYNVLRDSPQGMNVASRYAQPGGLLVSDPTRRVAITDNVFESIGPGNLLQLGGDLDRVTLARNTALGTAPLNAALYLLSGPSGTGPQTGLVVRDNALALGAYGLFGDAIGVGSAALAQYAPNALWSGNVLIGDHWYPSTYPSATTWLVPGTALPAGVGADTAAVRAATAGVVVP